MDKQKLIEVAKTLEQNKGRFFSIISETQPNIPKKYDNGGLVSKMTQFTGQSSTSYANRVKKKNPEFELSERRWGKRMGFGGLIEHKGEIYLEVIFNPDDNLPLPRAQYFINGKPVDKDDVNGLKEPYRAKSGIDVRTFKASSIKSIAINGRVYE